MFTRRRALITGLGMLAAGYLAPFVRDAKAAALDQAMEESDLIYITPIRGDGSESNCQAEVWFARHGSDLFVVTASTAWRARAVDAGLTRARVWVGDVGVWSKSSGTYRTLPQVETEASLVADTELQNAVLDVMGKKFRMSWLLWGPRFRNGLADGSRVMLRYRPLAG